MVRDLSIAAFMNELLVAHENAHPQYDWAPLKALDFDESERPLQRWLVPAFKRERGYGCDCGDAREGAAS